MARIWCVCPIGRDIAKRVLKPWQTINTEQVSAALPKNKWLLVTVYEYFKEKADILRYTFDDDFNAFKEKYLKSKFKDGLPCFHTYS
jgi:hypothetical protein